MQAASTPQRAANLVSCPLCGSQQCIRVDQQGLTDTFKGWVGRFPWYCRGCKERFYLETRSA
jgi:hypothetical protein